ncbi:MFS transporter [Streptomyces sp. Ru73]|uniref:MFS transporter n=1 Tax=Streptomyces sp. Ru73 TaxID=2080748 RepID=UPI000CDCEE2C|nr:MFS transporter [Streptomyces sp. Ru73]POX38174.1 MFS transporter [Streptomyces sp. Ru73]
MAVHPSEPSLAVPADPPGPPGGTPRRAWLITALIVVFMVINHADKAVLGLAAVPLMAELDIGRSTYGLVAGSFYLLFSLSGLVVGFFSARISTRGILFTLTMLWAVAQLPVLLVAAVPTLVAGRVLLGAAEGPAAAMSMHALYKWFPADRRGLPSALHISGAALGTLLAAPFLTWLISDFGWRAAFGALAVLSLGWGLVWLRTGHEGPFGEDGRRAAAGAGTERAGRKRWTRRARQSDGAALPHPKALPYRKVLLTGTVLGGICSAFAAQWALALASAWLPAYLRTQAGMGAAHVGLMVSGISALSFVLLLTVSPFTDRLKTRGASSRAASGVPQGVAVLVAACALAAVPFAGPGPAQLVLLAVGFGCHAVALPLHYVTTAEVVPARQRGAVFGIVAATGTLPGLIVPYLTGRLLDGAASESAGYTQAFLLTAAVMAACGALALATIRPERDAARLELPGALAR